MARMKPLKSLLFVESNCVLVKLPAISPPAVSPDSAGDSDTYNPPSYAVSRKFAFRINSTPPWTAWRPTCTTALPL